MDAYEQEQIALKKLNEDWKKQQVRMKLAHDQQLELQAREAEVEELQRIEASNQPPVMPDTVDLSKGTIVNGKFIERPVPQPSIAVAKTAQLAGMNKSAMQKKQR